MEPELAERAKRANTRADRTVASLLRVALRRYLDEEEGPPAEAGEP